MSLTLLPTPCSQSRSLLYFNSDPDFMPVSNPSSPLSSVRVCVCVYVHARIYMHVSCGAFLPPSLFFLYTSSLLLSPFRHVSSLCFPHAEMGHLSLTGTKTRTGTLDLAPHLSWPVHVWGQQMFPLSRGERGQIRYSLSNRTINLINEFLALWSVCKECAGFYL